MSALAQLLEIMARLRDPQGGCPWDLEQSFASIAPYTLEEAYEVADAIERNDMAALKEELGDLLLQVVFHAQMAGEAGLFTFEDVAEAINAKMIARHPHVFAVAGHQSPVVSTAEDQLKNWEKLKDQEKQSKGQTSALDDLPLALPALTRAQKLAARAARTGFDWPEIGPVYDKLQEELAELRAAQTPEEKEEELGDLLFVAVNLARHLKVDAETALRRASQKFERRFRYVEERKAIKATLEAMDALWDQTKASGV